MLIYLTFLISFMDSTKKDRGKLSGVGLVFAGWSYGMVLGAGWWRGGLPAQHVVLLEMVRC